LPDDMSLNDQHMREVFNVITQRVVKDIMYDARVKEVVVWHKHQKTNMRRETAKKIHLIVAQFRESEVD
jgi:predicted acetyltransferase